MKNTVIIVSLLLVCCGLISDINGYWFQYFEISEGTCGDSTIEVEISTCADSIQLCNTIFQFTPMLSPGGINFKQFSDSSCTNEISIDYLFCSIGDYTPRIIGNFSIVCQNVSQIGSESNSFSESLSHSNSFSSSDESLSSFDQSLSSSDQSYSSSIFLSESYSFSFSESESYDYYSCESYSYDPDYDFDNDEYLKLPHCIDRGYYNDEYDFHD